MVRSSAYIIRSKLPPLKRPKRGGFRSMSNDLAVEAAGLEKSYGKVRVLAGVDLRVPRGSIFALLDPNEAGKANIGY